MSTAKLQPIILASSMGTLIEWYDFYIFGSLAPVIATQFFPQSNPTAAFLSTLAAFAAGFVVRPFGALFFGRLGDLIGRKYTFLVTLLLMGGSTFLMGCIPSYQSIGMLAPLLVLLLRLLQGLALGGEYGGAATYVAEYAPNNRRGFWTSWIQTTATVGLFVSLMVILVTRQSLGNEPFEQWGWRIPFWVSLLLVIISFFIRKNMQESPVFTQLKSEGRIAANPLKESFGNRYNFKFVLLALFGATMGQGVVWYTGQFYAMSFLSKVCHVAAQQTDTIMAIALLSATPFFVVFGGLSDKIGRKSIMMVGLLLAILCYRPIFHQIYTLCDTSVKSNIPFTVSESKSSTVLPGGIDSLISISRTQKYADGTTLVKIEKDTLSTATGNILKGKTPKLTVTLNRKNQWQVIGLIFILVIFVTMVYGPIAAFLVELFPARIRYTSMSLPYHIGNGIFGGLLPTVATYLVSNAQKNGSVNWHLQGLWYPILVGAVCLLIGMIYLNKNIEHKNDTIA
jgi:MFS family permease